MFDWFIWHSLRVLLVVSSSFSLGYYTGIKKNTTSIIIANTQVEGEKELITEIEKYLKEKTSLI